MSRGAVMSRRGELDLIKAIRRRIGAPAPRTVIGPGDDAAVIEPGKGLLLLTSDIFVEDVHFRRCFATFEDIGAKCMTANLSDIAAMGGFPTKAVVSLCVPDDLPDNGIDRLYDGMLDVLSRHGGEVVGGDIVGTPGGLVVSIALIGAADQERIVPRSGAVVGDTIIVTGHFGGAEAGLRSLASDLDENADVAAVRSRHRRPVARVAEAQAIIDVATPHAMIDVSDGLSSDLLHIAAESGVGVEIEEDAVPVASETARVGEMLGVGRLELALGSGEEFELIVTIPGSELERTVEHVRAVTGTAVTPIGRVVPRAQGRRVVTGEGGERELTRTGYEHLSETDER
ncbi:MAG: thiamine-phosphate kinase [Candidatus Eisenbacteria bacterium]|nr:thiamine-phosphate kinase [Candidatus Eisenbacteria bacterium]